LIEPLCACSGQLVPTLREGRKLGSIAWQRPFDRNSSRRLSVKSGPHSQRDGLIAPGVFPLGTRALLRDNVTSVLSCERSVRSSAGTSHPKHFARCFFAPFPTFQEDGHTRRVDGVATRCSVLPSTTSQTNLLATKCQRTLSVSCRFTRAVCVRARTPNGHVLAPCRHVETLHVEKVASLLTTHSVSCGVRSKRFETAKSLRPSRLCSWRSDRRSCPVVQTSSHAEPLGRVCSHAC